MPVAVMAPVESLVAVTVITSGADAAPVKVGITVMCAPAFT